MADILVNYMNSQQMGGATYFKHLIFITVGKWNLINTNNMKKMEVKFLSQISNPAYSQEGVACT